MRDIADQIVAWQAAGVIDAETAARLLDTLPSDGERATRSGQRRTGEGFGDLFGPGVQVAEAFAYLGIGFLAASWTAFLGTFGGGDDGRTSWIVGSAVAALAFAGIWAVLRLGDARRRRGAGAAALLSTGYAATAFAVATEVAANGDGVLTFLVSSLGATVAAAAFRWALPALLTQVGVLASATAFAGAVMSFVRESIFGGSTFDAPMPSTDAVALAVLEAAAWVIVAFVFGLLGLREARAIGDAPAQRRASLTRLWAGLTAVSGVAMGLMRTGPLPGSDFEYGRLLEPWIGELALIILAAVLVERAFRRSSSTFLLAGVLALLIALTDFNASYLTDSIQTGLLVEGMILLAIGYGANRLRHRLGRLANPAAEPAGSTTG